MLTVIKGFTLNLFHGNIGSGDNIHFAALGIEHLNVDTFDGVKT